MNGKLLNSLSSRGALLFSLAFLALMFTYPAQAATITVDADCTIIEAMNVARGTAQTGCETGSPSGGNTILISGSHTLTANLPAPLANPITIIGSNNATINGNNQYRIFDNTFGGSNVTIRNLTIRGGATGGGLQGAAITLNGTLTLENVVIRNNTASHNPAPGGIYQHAGALIIRNSVIHNNTNSNTGYNDGGAFYINSGTATIENTTFYNNSVSGTTTRRTEGIFLAGGTTTLRHITVNGHYGSLTVGLAATRAHVFNSIFTGTGEDCKLVQGATALTTNVGNIIEDNTCSPAISGDPKLGTLTNGYYPLLADSPAINAASAAHCTYADQRGVRRISSKCDIGAYAVFRVIPDDKEEDEDEEPYIPPTPMPPTYTGEGFFGQTGIRVSATHGLRSGVQFKRIGAANIGLPSVLNNGFIDAVDVFGYVNQGVEVCFPRSGALLFLDAATSPRTVLPWPSTIVDNFTCGRITRPGTLVLVPLNSPLAGPVSTPQPAPAAPGQPSSSGQTSLTDCFVTTTHILNLRESPNGDIIGRVNYNATLSARGRDGAWFQITVDGLSGWISADFVRTRGNCS